jgi:arabinogalactan endo-1,4-beta-galactosidase
VEAWQTLEGLKNDWYTLSAWVRSSGDQKAAYIALKDCGSPEQRASVPIAPANKWLHIVISTQVKNGKCTISLGSEAGPKDWISFDTVGEPSTNRHEYTNILTKIYSCIRESFVDGYSRLNN